MIPVAQTRFGYPNGNCEMAAILSVLGLGFDAIPDWEVLVSDPDYDDKLKAQLAELGVALVWWSTGAKGLPTDGYRLACGASPRACPCGGDDDECKVCWESKKGHLGHTVVLEGDELAHDPHPSGDGLLAVDYVGYIILIHQGRLRRAQGSF